ncbi:MAG: STAS domain-containing protein [Cucumibacter sp.]
MDIIVDEVATGVTRVVLDGRMDIDGATSVDDKFAVIARRRRPVIVDLGEVTFLASMGIRTLMFCAKALLADGVKMALYNPRPGVDKVLRTSGVDTVMPVVADQVAAMAAVSR